VRHEQDEFLFADGPQPELHRTHPLDDLFVTIAEAWGVPVGRGVRLNLINSALPELTGKLEVVRSPDLPLDGRELLYLRLKGVLFTHREIANWTLLES
jgi:hypothetical protein